MTAPLTFRPVARKISLDSLLRWALPCLLFLTSLAPRSAGQAVNTLYGFNPNNGDGTGSNGGLMQASDGNFYGMTTYGGASGAGTIYRLTPAGVYTRLHSFSPATPPNYKNADGAFPQAGLVQASDGALYGVTLIGGTSGFGTLFRITLQGAFTPLYSFSFADANGDNPACTLLVGPDGNLYGTTTSGAPGSVFSFAARVFQATLSGTMTPLHTFNGGADGASSASSLIVGSDGALYGTTSGGGAQGRGVVFRITTDGTESVLCSFGVNSGDPAIPQSGLTLGRDGNFYGAAYGGGANLYGALYKVTPTGTLTTLHSFGPAVNNINFPPFGTNPDGLYPVCTLVQLSDGWLYGSAPWGGINGFGTLYRVKPTGQFQLLYTFSSEVTVGLNVPMVNGDGAEPDASLAVAKDGSLYGVTYAGGIEGEGVIYRFDLGAPAVTLVTPASVNAPSPNLNIAVRGNGFTQNAIVNFNGQALTTQFVSSKALKATIPAALLATPRYSEVTVSQNRHDSNAYFFNVAAAAKLSMQVGTPSRDTNGNVIVPITLLNSGSHAAQSLSITAAKLKSAPTATAVPISFGDLPAGAKGSTSLTFPKSVGHSGSSATLQVSGTYYYVDLTVGIDKQYFFKFSSSITLP